VFENRRKGLKHDAVDNGGCEKKDGNNNLPTKSGMEKTPMKGMDVTIRLKT
jgi:hypothetical protein